MWRAPAASTTLRQAKSPPSLGTTKPPSSWGCTPAALAKLNCTPSADAWLYMASDSAAPDTDAMPG